jgi:hypothetical protein
MPFFLDIFLGMLMDNYSAFFSSFGYTIIKIKTSQIIFVFDRTATKFICYVRITKIKLTFSFVVIAQFK